MQDRTTFVIGEAAGACYGRGLQRLPWLFVTEALRNALLGFGIAVAAAPAAMVGSVAHDAGGLLQAAGLLLFAGVLLLPVAWIGYRLALATEAVVLGSPNTLEAFRASYRLTAGRFERWLEMLVVSVLLGLCAAFVAAFLSVAVTGPPIGFWLAAAHLLVVAVTPVIQYAWTFFYLRLAELHSGSDFMPPWAPEVCLRWREALDQLEGDLPADRPVSCLREALLRSGVTPARVGKRSAPLTLLARLFRNAAAKHRPSRPCS